MVVIALISGFVAVFAGLVWLAARLQRDRILTTERRVKTYAVDSPGDPATMLATERTRLYGAETQTRLRRLEVIMQVAAVVAGVAVAVGLVAIFVTMPDESDIV